MDARKVRLTKKEALALLAQVDEIYSAKGKRTTHVELKKDRPSDGTLLPLIMGPTGNLRAPALRIGRILLVGFDQTTYEKLLR